MQLNQTMKANSYVLAGEGLNPFERIVESRSVDVPGDAPQDESQRVAYRAPREQTLKRRGVALPWALLMILGVVAIMSMVTLQKAGNARALEAEVQQLSNRFLAAEQERMDLEEAYLEACDSSYITYYAAQNLKMKRALFEETIQVMAPSTRPVTQFADSNMLGMAGRH